MPSLSVRLNNPGLIRDGAFARNCQGYAGPGEKGFARFDDWGLGLGALARLLRMPSYQGLTIREIISRYAPDSENDTEAYIRHVCQRTGLKPEDKITNPIILADVMAAITAHEGWRP